jgi:hypothetical protein
VTWPDQSSMSMSQSYMSPTRDCEVEMYPAAVSSITVHPTFANDQAVPAPGMCSGCSSRHAPGNVGPVAGKCRRRRCASDYETCEIGTTTTAAGRWRWMERFAMTVGTKCMAWRALCAILVLSQSHLLLRDSAQNHNVQAYDLVRSEADFVLSLVEIACRSDAACLHHVRHVWMAIRNQYELNPHWYMYW